MTQTVPAGWYPDPGSAGSVRYWDGRRWTEHVAPASPTHRRKEDWPPLPFAGVRADFGRRALGYVIDSVVLWIPTMAVLVGAFFAFVWPDLSDALGDEEQLEAFFEERMGGFVALFFLLQAVALLVPVLYRALLVADGRQTVGHRLAGVRVVDAATGTGLPLGRAFLRSLVENIGSAQVAGLGYWWALFDPEHRTWHDIAARTTVIDLRQSGTTKVAQPLR